MRVAACVTLLVLALCGAVERGAVAAPDPVPVIRTDLPLLTAPGVITARSPLMDIEVAGPAGVPLEPIGSRIVAVYTLESEAPVTVAVTFNGVRVLEQTLQPGPDGRLTAPTPAELVRPGANAVRIEAMVPRCNDGAAWLLSIGMPSYIHFALAQDGPALDQDALRLANFPQPFAFAGGQPLRTTIVVPHDPTPYELTAALTVAAGLGRAGYTSTAVSLRTAGQVSQNGLAGTHSILIGSFERNPWLDRAWLKAEPLPGQATLVLRDSQWAWGYATLAVVGEGPPLEWATRSLVGQSTRDRMPGPHALVTAAVPAQAPTSVEGILPLVDDAPLAISSPGGLSLAPSLPRLGDGATVDLVAATTGQGAVEVRVNGVSVGTAEGPNARVAIPPALLHAGPNTLDLRSSAGECDAPAIALLPGSHLAVSTGNLEDVPFLPSFLELPHPFADGATTDSTYIVTPAGEGPLDAAASFAVLLGDRSGDAELVVRGATPETLPAGVRGTANLVLVDLAGNNPLVEAAFESLPYYIHPGRALLTRDDVAVVSGEDETALGLLEFVRSPFNPDRSLLLISATDAAFLLKGVNVLAGPAPSGNLALVHETGLVASLTGHTRESRALSSANDYPEDTIAQGVVVLAVVAMAALFAQLLIGSRRRRVYR